MRVLLVFLFSFLFLFGSELKIATYNVENLFDGINQGTEYKDFDTRSSNWNNAKYQRKLELVSNLLKEIDADIVALQEIENKGVLENLAKKSGYEYSYFSKSRNSPIGVGVVSKIPFSKTSFYRPKDIKTRDIVRVDFEYNNFKFSIFTTHFLAKNNELIYRKRNARALEEAIKNTNNVIILGDFNTEYGKNSLLNEMTNNNNLVNLWRDYTLKKSSHITGRAIDHIMISKDFFKNKNLSYKQKSFKIYDKISNISDHYPLIFTLTVDEQEFTKAIKPASINEFYGKINLEFPFVLKDLVVTFKDKNGFAVADKTRRGVYVFDRDSDLKVGEKIDIEIFSTGFFQNNFQIDSSKILSKKGMTNLDEYTLNENELCDARHADVINEISGVVKNGYLNTKFETIKIHSFDKELSDTNNQVFRNAFFTIFKGEKELIVK